VWTAVDLDAVRPAVEMSTGFPADVSQMGLTGELVDDADMESRLAEYRQVLAERAPTPCGSPSAVSGAPPLPATSKPSSELTNIRRAFESEDAAEARNAFFEKRRPSSLDGRSALATSPYAGEVD